jgi:hypothetical protein
MDGRSVCTTFFKQCQACDKSRGLSNTTHRHIDSADMAFFPGLLTGTITNHVVGPTGGIGTREDSSSAAGAGEGRGTSRTRWVKIDEPRRPAIQMPSRIFEVHTFDASGLGNDVTVTYGALPTDVQLRVSLGATAPASMQQHSDQREPGPTAAGAAGAAATNGVNSVEQDRGGRDSREGREVGQSASRGQQRHAIFNAHKEVLAQQSRYFYTMFHQDAAATVVDLLSDVTGCICDARTMETFLMVVYNTGGVEQWLPLLSKADLLSLLRFSHYVDAQWVISVVQTSLIGVLNAASSIADVIETMCLADSLKLQDLRQWAVRSVSTNIRMAVCTITEEQWGRLPTGLAFELFKSLQQVSWPTAFKAGDRVMARWRNSTAMYPATVATVTISNTPDVCERYYLRYDDSTFDDNVPVDHIRLETHTQSLRPSHSSSSSSSSAWG